MNSIIDIKGKDIQGHLLQVEVQTTSHPGLPERIHYTFCDLFRHHLKEGEPYDGIHDTIAIWILDTNLFRDDAIPIHLFQMKDRYSNLILGKTIGIITMELPKWPESGIIDNDLKRWCYLFRHGEEVDMDTPQEFLDVPEIKKAMNVRDRFSEDEMARELLDERRKHSLLVQKAYEIKANMVKEKTRELETLQKKLETAKKELEAEKKRVEAKKKNVEALKEEVEAAVNILRPVILNLRNNGFPDQEIAKILEMEEEKLKVIL